MTQFTHWKSSLPLVKGIEVTLVINILYGGREEGVHPPSTSIDTLVTGMVKGIDFAGMQPEMPQQISPLFHLMETF